MSRVSDERRAAGALEREALRRMVQPKNQSKGSWSSIPLRELVALIRSELDEVDAAIANGEGDERIREELGDLAATTAMAIDVVTEGACCCIGGDHPIHCPGFFWNEETSEVERCDECATFASDEDVEEFLGPVALATLAETGSQLP